MKGRQAARTVKPPPIQIWLCRAKNAGCPFPTFEAPYSEVELLNWQVGGTVMLRGGAELVKGWAQTQHYTTPQPPLAGLYLVDEETVFYINATGEQVETVRAVHDSVFSDSPMLGQLSESQACDVLTKARRVFPLSDLSAFEVQRLLLDWFGVRSRSPESWRRR